ncbi:MAG: OmpA family protein [Bacteroidales bacterium]|nr:OmpA family protein [Bacteroidales bacterium]
MIKFKTMLAALALTLGVVQTATAQDSQKEETRKYPYAFVGVQGGAQFIANGYKVTDVLTPVAALNGGVWVSPALGVRAHVNAWEGKEGVWNSTTDFGNYKFNYVAGSIDLMVNLTNAFSKTDNHAFEVILLGGIGANKAWGKKYNAIPNYAWDGTTAPVVEIGSKVHNHVAHYDRLGLQFNLNLGQNWAVNLEGQANHIGSRSYAHEFNGAKNWQIAALLGLTYKFGAKAKKAPVVVDTKPVVIEDPKPTVIEEKKPVSVDKPKPVVVEEKKPIVEERRPMSIYYEIHYAIAKSEPVGTEAEKVASLAAWMKENPKAKATIKGYADAGTGNARINARYAQERAEGVKKLLVEKYGIDASRLEVSSFGDTVQPFSENDSNRVVIAVAESK